MKTKDTKVLKFAKRNSKDVCTLVFIRPVFEALYIVWNFYMRILFNPGWSQRRILLEFRWPEGLEETPLNRLAEVKTNLDDKKRKI
jgi:hypothetical protein